jgi:dephospho-CoA kinase
VLDALGENAPTVGGATRAITEGTQVSKSAGKPVIGIVGGIASGKSTVAAEFERLGCARIDAEAIVKRFGTEILNASGDIDRRRLAEKVFADERELAALNAIVHPLVLQRVEAFIERYSRDDSVVAVVLDMPLLVEVGWAERCDRIVFVDSRRERRFERARRKSELTESDLKIREKFQISLDSKAALADNTIDNNSDFSALVRQIQEIFSDMTKK